MLGCTAQKVKEPKVLRKMSKQVVLLNLFDVFSSGTKIIGFYTEYSCDFSHKWVNCQIENNKWPHQGCINSCHKRQ